MAYLAVCLQPPADVGLSAFVEVREGVPKVELTSDWERCHQPGKGISALGDIIMSSLATG